MLTSDVSAVVERALADTILQLPEIPWKGLEPATRIERATCGLRTGPDPTSDNVTPQETTTQDSPDMGQDGASLPCPGSSVVADQASGDDE